MDRKKISMTAAVLAGGKSSRMGKDKSLLSLGEKTFLEKTVKLVSSIFQETIVMVDKKEKVIGLDLNGAQIKEDFMRYHGPLGGIYTALCLSKYNAVCVFTCDMPFVEESLIRSLAGLWSSEWDALCFKDDESRLQPFPGIYNRSARSLMRLLIDQDESSMHLFMTTSISRTFDLQTKGRKAFFNMNTLEDYQCVLNSHT